MAQNSRHVFRLRRHVNDAAELGLPAAPHRRSAVVGEVHEAPMLRRISPDMRIDMRKRCVRACACPQIGPACRNEICQANQCVGMRMSSDPPREIGRHARGHPRRAHRPACDWCMGRAWPRGWWGCASARTTDTTRMPRCHLDQEAGGRASEWGGWQGKYLRPPVPGTFRWFACKIAKLRVGGPRLTR
jgi:hypothetical protein